ncbi:MAG: 50S ribosomal protein L25/general stress protein Ctc [Acidobacteria bacterium]|nr:50S ribosomal protein L25/general stress protein Ctc [Acidobacteriota bacterium]
MQEFYVEATQREQTGTTFARQLRRQGKIPAVVYGEGKPATPITLDPDELLAIFHSETGRNTIFTLSIDGKKKTNVMIKDFQLDPVRGHLLHADLVTIAMDVAIKVKVPIEIVGVPQGVKLQGGILDLVTREIELECLPKDIPDHIKVDVSELEIADSLRVSNLNLDKNLKLLEDPDTVILTVVPPRAEEVAAPAEVPVAEVAEPEVIKKGKPVEEGEAAKAKEEEEEE